MYVPYSQQNFVSGLRTSSRLQVRKCASQSTIVMSNDPGQRLGRAANQNLGVTIWLLSVGTSVQGRR